MCDENRDELKMLDGIINVFMLGEYEATEGYASARAQKTMREISFEIM